MTKSELIQAVAKDTNTTENVVSGVLESVINTIKDEMFREQEVVIRGFGKFSVVQRGERVAQNISKGTRIVVPPKKVVVFKAYNDLKHIAQ